MSEWTVEDYAAEAADCKVALAVVASQMEEELVESMESHEETARIL